MPEPVDLRFAFGLEPRRAVEYFRAKGYAVTWNWDAMEAQAHARAFTVAKAMRLDVLQTIREALDRAAAEGTTLAEFQRTLRPRLEALGWWGKQVMERPDGTAQLVQTGSPRRLETIYRTNLQSAYMAGRYREFWDNREARPFWMYVAVMDQRTRPAHAALNGKIFRFDDPIWASCWPPNGYNCRCRVRALSGRDMERRGLALSESGANLQTFEDVDPSTGAVSERVSYKGPGMDRAFSPDRGFASNPGEAAWQPALERYSPRLQAAYLGDALDGPAFELFIRGQSDESFPIARVTDRLAGALEVEGAVVRFTAASRAKNFANHPELGPADYRFARTVIEGAEVGVRDRETHVVLMRRAEGWWVAVVKKTKTGKAVFLQSFRRSNDEDIRRLMQRGRVLWDERGGG